MSSLPPDDDGLCNSDLAPPANAKQPRRRKNPGAAAAGAVSGVTRGHEASGHGSDLPPDDDGIVIDDFLGHSIPQNIKRDLQHQRNQQLK